MWHCVSNKIFWVVCLWLLCFDFWAEIAYGKDELKLHKIQHYSHSRFFFLSLCTRFFSFLESANLLYILFSSLLKGKTLSQKHTTQKSKGKTHNIKLKSQNTEVTSYEHRIQNICTRNTMSYLGFRYTYCVLCADVLSSVFITCDFCVLTFEFHVLSFPFCVLCYMF